MNNLTYDILDIVIYIAFVFYGLKVTHKLLDEMHLRNQDKSFAKYKIAGYSMLLHWFILLFVTTFFSNTVLTALLLLISITLNYFFNKKEIQNVKHH